MTILLFILQNLCTLTHLSIYFRLFFQERNVDENIPCIRHLVHWNSAPAEGKGTTHEILTHRLRQLNRDDLADWLGKSTFKQLGKDLQRAMITTFEELGKQETELP